MAHRIPGFTLIEMIIVMAIVSILFASAVPSISGIMNRSHATTSVNWLVSAVNFTRHSAIQLRVTTTLCALKDETRCGGDWHKGLIVFTDHNRNARLDGKDHVLAKIRPTQESGTIKWRSFRNRKYLQMTPQGYTNYQNGNFVYCPYARDPELARQIVINMQGRVRVIHARNVDGVPVDRRGKQLRC